MLWPGLLTQPRFRPKVSELLEETGDLRSAEWSGQETTPQLKLTGGYDEPPPVVRGR